MLALLTVRVVIALFTLLVAVIGAIAYFFVHGRAPEPVAPVVVEVPRVVGPVHSLVGRSVEGRSIDAYSYLPAATSPAQAGLPVATSAAQAGGSGAKQILFVGGIHGGYEWNSVVLAYAAMDYFAAHPEAIPQNVSITIIPSANPDGVYKVVGKEGRFGVTDVPTSPDQSSGRFNAHGVDLNRNFDCKWQPTSIWKNKKVSAGTAPFSEPEAAALRDYFLARRPTAVVFWHSKAGGVYASQCENGILPQTLAIMNAYSQGSGYPATEEFTAYPTTGASEDWLAKVGIPAITVELSTHEGTEWEKNLAGIRALLDLYK